MLKVVVDPAALTELVTLEEAIAHLRVMTSDEDDLIQIYIDAAVQSCLTYCDLRLVPIGAEPSFKAAALLLVGQFFRHRMAINVGNIVNELPFGVPSLLDPYRTIRV